MVCQSSRQSYRKITFLQQRYYPPIHRKRRFSLFERYRFIGCVRSRKIARTIHDRLHTDILKERLISCA